MTYRDQVIADGARNYWRLDETTGTVAKDILNGATGTISGGVILGQPGALTDGNPAMMFNGTTGKVVTAANVPIPLVCTIEAWLKYTAVNALWLSTRGTGTTGDVVYVGVEVGHLYFFAAGIEVRGTRTDLNTGLWHHCVYVLTGTTCTLYVDGVADGTSALTRTTPSGGTLKLAWDEIGANFWNGALDEIAIYPVALTAAQVAAHYQLGRAAQHLVTLDQVKRRLRITSTADDVDLQDLADQAEAKIVNWCSTTPRAKAIADAWDAITVPPVVVAAILVQAGEFYRFRGDDVDALPRQDPEELPVLVRELLRAYHDPGIA